MSNTSLWERVATTDPNHTKEFNRGGGFKGTAINPTYQMLKATEIFGPVGMGFGWKVADNSYVHGGVHDGEGDVIHVILLDLWYRVTAKFVEMMPEAQEFLGQVCVVTHFGQTTFVGRNKNGPYTDEEAPKKSLTDAVSKCLSCLGFSADIHMGLYDSNKYVNDRRREFGTEKQAVPIKSVEPVKSEPKPMTWNDTIKEFVVKALAEVATEEAARKLWAETVQETGITKEHLVPFTELTGLFTARVAAIRATKT